MTILNVLGIVLVVIGHSGFEESEIVNNLSGLHRWIYSFHMPLFFFISGFLFSLTNPDLKRISSLDIIKKKTLRLLVPYFVLGVIIFAIKFTFQGLSHATRNFTAGSFLYMFIAPQSGDSTMGYLWFLFTLFAVFMIVLLLIKIRLPLQSSLFNVGLAVVLWVLSFMFHHLCLFNLSAVLWYMPFFLVGMATQRENIIEKCFNESSNIAWGGVCNSLIVSYLHGAISPCGIPIGYNAQ